jgi:benzoylformate decarboxylase
VMLDDANSPALVVGAGADSPEGWEALVALAERLACPVWQESFGARAGFPQDHPQFAGHLPAGRARLRQAIRGHDVVLTVGAAVFRQYPYEPGPLADDGTRLAVVTDDPAEAHRSPVVLAVVASPAVVCQELGERVRERPAARLLSAARPAPAAPPGDGEPLRGAHVLTALGERLPPDSVVVEEAPSNRPELLTRLPARRPLGFLSAAMGGLGFALPGSIGVRMGLPDRPVVAVVGDGSSLFGIQSLWSAARYGAGVLFVVLANGGYAVMDRLAEIQGQAAPWPDFGAIDIAAMARAQGCAARRVATHDELVGELDEVVPGLARRNEPLLLEVTVAPDRGFNP